MSPFRDLLVGGGSVALHCSHEKTLGADGVVMGNIIECARRSAN